MTDAVDPSVGRTADHRLNSSINRYGHADWVVPTDRDIVAGDIGLSGTPLNAFAATTSTSSLDVTIASGEAIIDGRYVARDVNSSVTLPSGSASTVYVGSNDADTDSVTLGTDSAFTSPYSRIALFDFVTDGSGVTDTTDRRPIGEPLDSEWHLVAETTDSATTDGIDVDTGTVARSWNRYRITIRHENHDSSEQDLQLRLNGIGDADYEWDAVDGVNGDIDSRGPATEWQDIARAASGQHAYQTLEVAQPRPVSPLASQYPLISLITPGMAKQRDALFNGTLLQDPGTVDRLRVFGGTNSTGVVRIYGSDY